MKPAAPGIEGKSAQGFWRWNINTKSIWEWRVKVNLKRVTFVGFSGLPIPMSLWTEDRIFGNLIPTRSWWKTHNVQEAFGKIALWPKFQLPQAIGQTIRWHYYEPYLLPCQSLHNDLSPCLAWPLSVAIFSITTEFIIWHFSHPRMGIRQTKASESSSSIALFIEASSCDRPWHLLKHQGLNPGRAGSGGATSPSDLRDPRSRRK